jgi:hypothetical protein
MASIELRVHLRIQAEGRAIVILPDGRRVETLVRDISLGGAYLLRDESRGRVVQVESGAEVEVYLYHIGHAANAVTVQGTILRVAPDDEGFVVRFAADAALPEAPLHKAIVEEAEKRGIAPARLHVRGARLSAAGRILRAVVKIAAVLLAYGGVRVLWGWLDAVL